MKNEWLQKKKIKLHDDLFSELMAAMDEDTTLGELIDALPKKLKDYFLGFQIYGVESCADESTFELLIENYEV